MNSFSNRILIPEVAGGPRLRYDARPWIIMMASSVHHADNAGRNNTDEAKTGILRISQLLGTL
jgi:hypothetical protein